MNGLHECPYLDNVEITAERYEARLLPFLREEEADPRSPELLITPLAAE